MFAGWAGEGIRQDKKKKNYDTGGNGDKWRTDFPKGNGGNNWKNLENNNFFILSTKIVIFKCTF